MSDDDLIVEKADVVCPSCGAPLEFEEGDRMAECEYCGTHIRLRRIKESVDEKDPHWAEHRRNEHRRNEPSEIGKCSVCGGEVTIDRNPNIDSSYHCTDCDALLCSTCKMQVPDEFEDYCPTCYEDNGHAHRAKMKQVKSVGATLLAFGLLGSVIFAMWKAGGSQ